MSDSMSESPADDHAAIYLVGAGIASLAAAAFLIRDGDVPGQNITILDESAKIGGSLDAAGSPTDGYTMRSGRMIESKYFCTFDLFSSIPTLDESKTVTQEIFDWNETIKTSSKSRLFRDGQRVDAPKFGPSENHILTIERLGLEPEGLLGRSSISDQFDASFFETDFWFMWCTTFAFQCLPTMAQCCRVQALSGAIYSDGCRLQYAQRHYANCLQPVRLDGTAATKVAGRTRGEVSAQYPRHES
jgi:oleate hydratase